MIELKRGDYLGSNKKSFLADGVILSETIYINPVFQGWHNHENTHITLLIAGGNKEQRRSKETEATPGNILFYHSGEQHRNDHTLYPSKNINVEIEESFFKRYEIQESAINIAAINRPDTKFAILRAYREHSYVLTNNTIAVHSLLLSLCSISDHLANNKIPSWFGLLKEILNDHWNETLTLDQLSKTINIHPVTISKAFPRYFNCTLSTYLRKIRIDRALTLLKTTDMSLTQVAYFCGFFDQSHFIRTFKAATGFLPKTFKKL